MSLRTDLVDAVRELVKTLAAAPDRSVIYAGEKGTRPDKPYVTVRLTTPGGGLGPAWRAAGVTPADGDLDDPGTVPNVRMRERREAIVSIQGYGPTTADWLDKIQIALDSPASLALQETLGIAAMVQTPVRDLSTLLDTAEEQRFSLELRLRYIHQSAITDQVAVERVEVHTDLRRSEDDPDTLSADQSVQFT